MISATPSVEIPLRTNLSRRSWAVLWKELLSVRIRGAKELLVFLISWPVFGVGGSGELRTGGKFLPDAKSTTELD